MQQLTMLVRSAVVLLILAVVAGCATQRGIVTTACDSRNGTLLQTIKLPRSFDEQTVRFQPNGSGSTCIEVIRGERQPEVVAVDLPDDTMTIRLGAEPALQAFNGGGYSSELTFSEDLWVNDRIAMRQRSDGRAGAMQIINPWSDLTLNIYDYDDRIPPDDGVREIVTYTLPPVQCGGQLRGFKPLDEYGQGVNLHPPLNRRSVAVYCTAVWVVDMRVGGSNVLKHTTGFTLTNGSGEYSIQVPEIEAMAYRSHNPPRLISITASCLIPAQCGYEAKTTPDQYVINLPIDEVPDTHLVDIYNVLDIVSAGPPLESVDGSPGPQLMLGARLLSRATSLPERNDKPFIIHEQLDVFNEEHTQFLAWGFSGQPYRETFVDDEGDAQRIDANTEPCKIEPEYQLCVGFSNDCNPTTCNNPDRGCLEYPMFQPMLDAGYDIWIVDHLRGQEDITHMAAAAPLLYQRILNYGGPDNSIVPIDQIAPLPALSETAMANYSHPPEIETPFEAYDLFEQQTVVAEPPPVPPVPRSGERRAVVGGFSLGGVVARTGLRLWEVRGSLPHNQLIDRKNNEVVLATSPDVFLEEAAKKVGLYVSFDAPHRGARIPTALQAHVKRFKAVADTFEDVSEADKAPLTRAYNELAATSTRQLLEQEIGFSETEPLGCFKTGSNPELSTCTLQPFTTKIKTRVSSDVSNGFESRWRDQISDFAPASVDGLPATIPSVAVSNGARGGPLDVTYAQFMHIKFDINNAFDEYHHLCDELSEDADQGFDVFGIQFCGRPAHQPAGSQWNNVCKRIRNVDVEIKPSGIDKGSFGGWLKSIYAKIFNAKVRGIDVTYPMQPRFDDNGAVKEGSGFPTIVRTQSSLLLTDSGRLSPMWRDALWQRDSQYHTNVDNQICRMVMWHADGVFERDGDGWPACGANVAEGLCHRGGRFPGQVLGTGPLDPLRAPCDCRPDDPSSYPGAREIAGDFVDNDCDGRVDEAVFEQ